MLPESFAPNDIKQDQIFSIDQIVKTKCYIKTLGAIEPGSVVSQAQRVVLESNQSDSVVFNSKSKSVFPVINNLPVVEYQVKGSSFCKTLLTQKEMRLAARPHSSYDVYFQVTGSHLRVLMSGALHELPYQRLSQALPISNDQYVIPIGGYSLQQGQIRNVMNVENQKTHILDFFPNEEPLQDVQSQTGIPQKIRESAREIYIPELSSGFSAFKYQEKPDLLPKTYFDGVWYSGVSIVSTKVLTRDEVVGSGKGLSGDNYSHYTPGQKVSFQFEAGRLKAINEYYKKQGDDLDYPAEAEVLSIPVKHLDYRNTLEAFSVDEDLAEPLSSHLSWQERRYVSVNFSKVDDFHRKRVRAVARRYLANSFASEELFNGNTFAAVKEVRFAPDYFDFVIDDGSMEYRFSFFKKNKQSTYQEKTIAKTDPGFEFFKLQDNVIFPDPLHSFRLDYENRIRLLRVHPNEKGLVPIHFSNLTPHDDLIRSIGRDAVSLWNQALSKADVSWQLHLDETKDVNIGDNRYHILNIPNEKNKPYAGFADFYADDETGELIATASNVILSGIQDALKHIVIGYAYEKYKLLNPLRSVDVSYPASMGKSFIFPSQKQSSLSYSIENLQYLLFTNQIHQFSKMSFPKSPQSSGEVHSYFARSLQLRNKIVPPVAQTFPDSIENLSPELSRWLTNFKITYALKQGRFMENESWEQIQNNVNNWGLDNFVYDGRSSELERTLSIVCHYIDNPLANRMSFEESVNRCVQQIYPMYALGLTVHELGHSLFSLRHNFSASADYSNRKDVNYYLEHLTPYLTYENAKGEEARVDSRFRNKASSVMDYIDLSDGEQWAPGSYDIAAIKFLFDAVQDQTEEPDLVKEATQFFNRKTTVQSKHTDRHFKRCSDWDVNSSAYCLAFDYGSKPHEIALNTVRSLFRVIDQYFYNQDRLVSDDWFYSAVFKRLWNLMVIYQDWRRHLDHYSRTHFNNSIERLDEEQRIELFSKFTSIFAKSGEEEELFSFYKARNLIYHTLTYLAFLPNRYCVLEKDWSPYDKKRWKPEDSYVLLELSKVISASAALSQGQQIYPLLSCWNSADQDGPHPEVARYIEAHYPGYSLKKEMGHFLYSHSLPQSAPYKEVSRRPYKGSASIRAAAFAALTLTEAVFPVPVENRSIFVSMMNERDIQKGVERLLLARLTRGVFHPVTDFFESFKESDLEYLSPARSAKNLFGFPEVEDEKPDIIFRDEFIQPEKLIAKKSPLLRTDEYENNFYQNFLEEKHLLTFFNYLYSKAYVLSGGISNDSISERSIELAEDIRVENSRTSNLLVEKTVQYHRALELPYLSALYYFELNDFLILPEAEASLDSVGNRVLSELAKNSVRLLWTKPYRKSFEGENLYTSQNTLKGGFGYHLYNYIGSFISQFQGSRLGRFYFMYTYLLALGLLDGYEKAVSQPGLSSEELHKQAMAGNELLQRTVLNLFGFAYCNGPAIFEAFYKNLENNKRMVLETYVRNGREYQKWIPAGSFQNTAQRVQYRKEFEKWVFDVCSADPMEKGKLQRLFVKEGNLLSSLQSYSLNDFIMESPDIQLPPFLRMIWQNRKNFAQERVLNEKLSKEVRLIENYLATRGGISGIHKAMNKLFQSTFPPFLKDDRLAKQWIQSNRQLLIDVIPKLLLMYSSDRIFVGEFMFLASMIHRYCLNDQEVSPQRCHIVMEKFIGHYFRGSDYASDPKLDFLFYGLFTGRIRTSDGQLPFSALLTRSPTEYVDRGLSMYAFDIEVVSDYLFYERGWDTMSADAEELEAQKDLLFTILPLGNLRILSSSNFALSNSIDLSMSRDAAAAVAAQQASPSSEQTVVTD